MAHRPPLRSGKARVLAVVKSAKIPAVRERLDPTGAEIVASNPQHFSAWLAAQRALLGNLIAGSKIKLG